MWSKPEFDRIVFANHLQVARVKPRIVRNIEYSFIFVYFRYLFNEFKVILKISAFLKQLVKLISFFIWYLIVLGERFIILSLTWFDFYLCFSFFNIWPLNRSRFDRITWKKWQEFTISSLIILNLFRGYQVISEAIQHTVRRFVIYFMFLQTRTRFS
jgi:hypothetical protein